MSEPDFGRLLSVSEDDAHESFGAVFGAHFVHALPEEDDGRSLEGTQEALDEERARREREQQRREEAEAEAARAREREKRERAEQLRLERLREDDVIEQRLSIGTAAGLDAAAAAAVPQRQPSPALFGVNQPLPAPVLPVVPPAPPVQPQQPQPQQQREDAQEEYEEMEVDEEVQPQNKRARVAAPRAVAVDADEERGEEEEEEEEEEESALVPEWAAPKEEEQQRGTLLGAIARSVLSLFFVPESVLKGTKVDDENDENGKGQLEPLRRDALSRFGEAAAGGLLGAAGAQLRGAFARLWRDQHAACEAVACTLAFALPHVPHGRASGDYIVSALADPPALPPAGPAPAPAPTAAGVLPRLGLVYVCHGREIRLAPCSTNNNSGLTATVEADAPVCAVADVAVPRADALEPVVLLVVATARTLCAYHVHIDDGSDSGTGARLTVVRAQQSVSVAGWDVAALASTARGTLFLGRATRDAVYQVGVTNCGVAWVREARVARPPKGQQQTPWARGLAAAFATQDGCRQLYVDDTRARLYVLTCADTVRVYSYRGAAVATVARVAVLAGFAAAVRVAFDDARPRVRSAVPAQIDALYAHYCAHAAAAAGTTRWALRRAERSAGGKWALVARCAAYCPPLVAGVVVVPADECPYATLAVVLNSGHRLYYDTRYALGQVRAAPPTLRPGRDVVVAAAGAHGCVAMQHTCPEEDAHGYLLLARTYRSATTRSSSSSSSSSSRSCTSHFVEELSAVASPVPLHALACYSAPSPVQRCVPGPTDAPERVTTTTAGAATATTKPSDVLSTGVSDPSPVFLVFSGRAVQRIAVAREADRLLALTRLADARTAVDAFLALYPPTLAGAVAFEAYAQGVCLGADAAHRSADAGARRDVVRECAHSSPHLAQRAPLCHQLGRLRAATEGQCLALDRMLAPVLAARAFRGCYDRRRRCCVVAPAAAPAQLDALRTLLARLEAAVLAYNSISPSALSQEKLLRQCVVAAPTASATAAAGAAPSFAEEQNVLCLHALLCRRLAQLAHLLAMLHGADGAALQRLGAGDRAWLHDCTLHDLALTERGNAAVAHILNAVVEATLARAHEDPAALFARLTGELSLFFTLDSRRVFAAKRLFLRLQQTCFLQPLPSSSTTTSSSSSSDNIDRDSKDKDDKKVVVEEGSLASEPPREVQGIVDDAMGQLRACSALAFSDLEAAVDVLCRAHCYRDAVVLVRTCSQRADPDNLAAKYEDAHTGTSTSTSASATAHNADKDDNEEEEEEGKQQYEYRSACYGLLLGLLEALAAGRVRRDCSLPADLSVLTADEVAFRDLLVLATAGAADALWLARLLQWLAARGLTHLVLQLEGPAVVRFLERHARRDVLLPRYYAVHGDALNGARAFYAAATAPTMPCTLAQREGSLLVAQRLARECPALAPGVAALRSAIATALTSIRFQQKVRAALREICGSNSAVSSNSSTSLSSTASSSSTTPPLMMMTPEEYERASAELTADIYPVAALVAAYVRPLRLTELELLALAAAPTVPADAPVRARTLWPRLLHERCAADPRLAGRACATVVHLCAALPPALVPLADIVRALEAHRAALVPATTGVAATYRDLQALPSAVDVLLAAKVRPADLLAAYAPLCTGTTVSGSTATETTTTTKTGTTTAQCVCVQSLLCLVGAWLDAARPALRAPRLADDLAQAAAVLRAADRAVLALVRDCAAALRAHTAAPLAAETAARCDAAAADIEAVRTSDAHRHALQYQRLP